MGRSAAGFDAWCEACQSPHALDAAPGTGTRCPRCGAQLFKWPRFVELWGMLQELDAVLAAWSGEPGPLARLLPERPVFFSDLTPPPLLPRDPGWLRSQLAALRRGDWRAVLEAPGPGPETVAGQSCGPRADAARAIAHERLGEKAAAIACWDAVLAAGGDERARLARGSLLARAGRLAEAGRDLERAGDSFPARWCRAALLIAAAACGPAEMPDAAVLARARAEAGDPSEFWSDPTVGRYLWSRLVARVLAAGPPGGRRASDEVRTLLRAAEAQLEHATFWDLAMVLVGWVRVGEPGEAARVARVLASRQVRLFADEPALAPGPATGLHDVTRALAEAAEAIDAGEPARAGRAIAAALAREDLRRFRIPCARCGRGSVGIDEVHEGIADGDR